MELSNDAKNAILNALAHAAWSTSNGQTYYDALANAFFPLSSISAVYTQSGTVTPSTPLDDLKNDLVVTANYEGGETETVPAASYTLSGTLAAGTSTITVSYAGKTTTFTVTVTSDSRADRFGTFTSGYALGKKTNSTTTNPIPLYGVWNNSATGRAAMTVPIVNKDYVITTTDSSKYTVAVYDITDPTAVSTTYDQAVTGVYYQGGTKSISWKTTDSATTPYIMISLKKASGSFTEAELANAAEAVFTFTSSS